MNALAYPQLKPALLLAAGMAVTVGTALGFQYIGGYIPCALCYLEREPYYYGIPVAILAAIAAAFRAPAWVTKGLLAIVMILMLVDAGIGSYHSGAEWGFWPGPSTCSTPVNSVTTNAGNLLNDINAVHGPSCTKAALRVLGLSLAGWNVIANLILAAIAIWGIRRKAA
jgi:disulfide bond formation protein DsbB